MMKHLTRSRGAAAVLLLTAAAPVLRAQETEPTRARPRDSVFVRMFTMQGIPMDSLKVLIRNLEREPYGSSDWLAITRRVDSLLTSRKAEFIARGMVERNFERPVPPGIGPTGWLGFVTQGPSQEIFDRGGQHVIYLAYPQIISVDPNSPADRAGIAPGDELIAYNGQDVLNRDVNLTELLQPDRKVSITVHRDGETKQYTVRVARNPERIAVRRRDLDAAIPPSMRLRPLEPPEPVAGMAMPAMPAAPTAPTAPTRLFVLPPEAFDQNGIFGASLSTVGPELAKLLDLKRGVLVNQAPEESPAWRSGLRAGDVIVSVEGRPVFSVNEFRERIMTHLPQHSAALQVVRRNQKPRTIRLSWPSP